MPLPAEIRPKLAKLFPMLSSDKAGTLQAAGADWHDLAEDFECAAEPLIVYRDALGRKTKPPLATAPLFEQLPRSARLDWLALAVASPLLSDWQREFAGSLRARVYSQPHSRLSPKQHAALNEVLAVLWIRGERP